MNKTVRLVKKFKQVICVYFMVIPLFANAAPLTIEITSGVEDALPIAIVPFVEEGKKPSENISAIIAADLQRTGMFKPFPVKDMLSKPADPNSVKFQNWRILGVENLVIGKVRFLGSDRYEISYWLYDVFKAKQIHAFKIPGPGINLRASAHKISDLIYEALLGEPGAFSTNIAYVTKAWEQDKSRYYLWTADADGHNANWITRSWQPIMSPSWSPDTKKIAYASLEAGGKQIIVTQDWVSQRRNVINVGRPGLFGAPSWSPDGKKLVFTITYNGNAEIYVINLANNKIRQLTRHWAIDTEAVWTPDGKNIIFTSDRGGKPQLYQMSSEGGRVKRLTFEGTENARATVSPDGRYVAMIHTDKGAHIAVMELSTGYLQVLPTDGRFAESPSFAPNGSMIIYATTIGERAVLASVSVDGRVTQKFSSGKDDVRDPSWSPLNKK